jgi:adenylosuccinate lyase
LRIAHNEFRKTPMIGRSHGIHAEPITFGLKLAVMYDEFGRALQRLNEVQPRLRVGKLSGAVGTHAHLDPQVETRVCVQLGLTPAALTTQILQRDPATLNFRPSLALIAIEHRSLGDRVPPSAANGSARGRRILFRRTEGELRDATQAEPHHGREN